MDKKLLKSDYQSIFLMRLTSVTFMAWTPNLVYLKAQEWAPLTVSRSRVIVTGTLVHAHRYANKHSRYYIPDSVNRACG